MNYRDAAVRFCFGRNRRGALLATGLGILVGGVVWLLIWGFDIRYWPGLHFGVNWAFVGGFVLLSAGVAFFRAGLLAAWWVSFPAHIALTHAQWWAERDFWTLPFQNNFLSFTVIAAEIALVYGLIGLLLGTVGRWVIPPSPVFREQATDR
jgi:hypothetical protein